MNTQKHSGFTLIELLIVVSIMAILAGSAIPYVQDYLDQARMSKCKVDMDEIKAALQRYEMERNKAYPNNDIASLIGPYLSKSLIDPWGGPYKISDASSTVYSNGADGIPSSGDEVVADFRPRLAVSRALWIDYNQNGLVDSSDYLNLKVTRRADTTAAPAYGATKISLSNGSLVAAGSWVSNADNPGRIASFAVLTAFSPGSDTVTIGPSSNIKDPQGNSANQDVLKITAP